MATQAPTLHSLSERKRSGKPIVMVTAYDWPTATAAEEAKVDLVLAGDTAAMTTLGYPSTVPVTVEEMLSLTAAVRRGLQTPLLIGDLPMGSYEVSDEQAVSTAQRFIKLGCAAVKLEGGGEMALSRLEAIIAAGIPAMGHLGVTPQTSSASGGFRARGRSAAEAYELLGRGIAIEYVGCFALVLEAVASEVAATISRRLAIPTIGIGAGPETDGQVLVMNDLLGVFDNPPRFAKRYAEIGKAMHTAVRSYAEDVRGRAFPQAEHCYSIPDEELKEFRRQCATGQGL